MTSTSNSSIIRNQSAGGFAGGSQIILPINKNGNYSSGMKSISVKTIKRAHTHKKNCLTIFLHRQG
jgi:hypothetical protein